MKKLKNLFKKLYKPAGYVLLVSLVIALTGAASQSLNDMTAKSVDIEVNQQSGNYFVSDKDVQAILASNRISMIGRRLSEFDLVGIEDLIEAHPFVLNAEIYINGLGEVKLDVSQRVPILRVINSNGVSYYIDENGVKMPFSSTFTARVPVATGYILSGKREEKTNKELFLIASYLKVNPFWSALIEQIHITRNNEIEIIPNVGNHTVLLGSARDLDHKLESLLLFYKQGLNKTGWYKYKMINLKYKDQIVCTKY
jgi:cell division protein FtsQ